MVSRRNLLAGVGGGLFLAGLHSRVEAAPEKSGGKEAGFSYTGKYAEEVKYLLSQNQTPEWSTGANDDGTPLKPPKFKLREDGAIRDTYIAAATNQAWAAEAYARTRQNGKAEAIATQMMTSLKQACDLCGDNGQVVGNGGELVTDYITCEWLKKRKYP